MEITNCGAPRQRGLRMADGLRRALPSLRSEDHTVPVSRSKRVDNGTRGNQRS